VRRARRWFTHAARPTIAAGPDDGSDDAAGLVDAQARACLQLRRMAAQAS
jgi:hypothetical protein